MLARGTVQLFDTTYLGSYLCVPVLGLLTSALLVGLRMPPPAESAVRTGGPVRPITQIVRQPIFIVAVLAQMMGQGVMNLLMTGTPLAMMAHHHTFADTAFVIQWHVVGMFLPGFFPARLSSAGASAPSSRSASPSTSSPSWRPRSTWVYPTFFWP